MINDIIGSLEAEWDVKRNTMFKNIEVETISLNDGKWTEKWIVSSDGVAKTFLINFIMSPQDGVYYQIQSFKRNE